jgi:hypothetical protein
MGTRTLSFLNSNWELIAGLVTLVWAGYSYFAVRRRELAWKRTEFLFAQSQYIDQNEEMKSSLRILEGRDPRAAVDQIFDDAPGLDATARDDYRQQFDTLLGHFDLIAYSVFNAKTLSTNEAKAFGWYLDRIVANRSLVTYCDHSGFKDVIRLAKELGLRLPV